MSCSAFSPKQKEPSEDAELVEAAEPEVRLADQGRKGLRALGLVRSPVSPRCTPLKAWFFPQVPKNDGSTLWPHSAAKIAVSTPGLRPEASGQETPSERQQGESSWPAICRYPGPCGSCWPWPDFP